MALIDVVNWYENPKDFIYKLEGYWWIFVLAVLLSGIIAFASVIWQVLKAAKTNPAVELKKE